MSTSYQAFLKVLRRWTEPLVLALQQNLRKRMESLDPQNWTRHGFVIFGTDGSKIDLPRTKSNQEAYASSRAGTKANKRNRRRKSRNRSATKKTQQPQLFLTTLFHVGLNLIWDWRIGPGDSSERGDALDMLASLPKNSLLTADAGFVGYDFSKTVLGSGCELLVRVGSNVKLLKQLGFVRESQGTVYVWPDKVSRKKLPPLVFRLVVVQGGRHCVYLLTSVTSAQVLTNRQVAELYRTRWGIELFYRHLKQTFGRRKLRSNSAGNARVELEWSLVGLWAVGLFASRELVSEGIPLERLSMALAIQSFRRIARDYLHPRDRRSRLRDWLRESLMDTYQRVNKTSRDYPRKKKEQPPRAPVIKTATKWQTQLAQQIRNQIKKG